MTDYDRELRLAELEGERLAVDALAESYRRLDHNRAATVTEHEVSPGQLRLVV
jgi:hypothetical protein